MNQQQRWAARPAACAVRLSVCGKGFAVRGRWLCMLKADRDRELINYNEGFERKATACVPVQLHFHLLPTSEWSQGQY